jgi:hypothetical protein
MKFDHNKRLISLTMIILSASTVVILFKEQHIGTISLYIVKERNQLNKSGFQIVSIINKLQIKNIFFRSPKVKAVEVDSHFFPASKQKNISGSLVSSGQVCLV